MMAIGKRVVDDLYIHLSASKHLVDAGLRLKVEETLKRISAIPDLAPNVAKINLRTGKVSLLSYPGFDEEPFPQLAATWVFPASTPAKPTYRHYNESLNPPILHRKELLVADDYPEIEKWRQLTRTAEGLGLFDDTTTIGFKLNWRRLIGEKGYRLVGKEFVPLGNELSSDAEADGAFLEDTIHRHLTALSRSNLSAPVQLLLRNGLLPPGCSVFDYGCGRGDDIAALAKGGFDARGWDPHYAADCPICEADVVNLGFVVNVIEDAAERVEAMIKAYSLARHVMSVSVMLYASEPSGREFRDGFVTSRNTFQKYFTQTEFKDYVEQVLHQEAHMAGLGVALVFVDKRLEQRYSAGRFRTRGVAARLLAAKVLRMRPVREAQAPILREPREPKTSRAESEVGEVKRKLESLWATALDLGRLPEPDEVRNLEELTCQVGTLAKANRSLFRHFDQQELERAAKTRSDDLLLFVAAQQFSQRQAYRQLEPRLQRDIKAFFGDYRTAQASALKLLLDAADPTKLLEACQLAASSGLGWLDGEHSLQLHLSLVERLPVLLRAYVTCGLILWGATSEVQLVKIHIGSGKLTLIELDDFDTSPTPHLRRRIKVNVRKQDCDLFEYGSLAYPKPLLYRKSRYLHEDYRGYAEQLAFDEALEATGILGDSEFGPPGERLLEELEVRRLGIVGMKLSRSERIPTLDQGCGTNFTFRALIDCGETQQRLSLRNLPLSPETYNALYDLATNILDPVVEYFGGVKLTYGFCSLELGRHISRRVAPKVDQHASLELNRAGTLICERGGAACDFLVEHEDMREVADWIIANTSFDRLYFYGSNKPIHVSYSPASGRQAYIMTVSKSGRLIPARYRGFNE